MIEERTLYTKDLVLPDSVHKVLENRNLHDELDITNTLNDNIDCSQTHHKEMENNYPSHAPSNEIALCSLNERISPEYASQENLSMINQDARLTLVETHQKNNDHGSDESEESETEDETDVSSTEGSSDEDTESQPESQNNQSHWNASNNIGQSKPFSNFDSIDSNILFRQQRLEVLALQNHDDIHNSRSGLDDVLNQYHQTGGHFQAPKNPVRNIYLPQNDHSVHYRMINSDGHSANYDQNNELLMHYRKEAPVDFPCQECGKVYNNRSSLRSHIKKHYPEEEKKYKCEKCSYSSHYHKNLVKHIDSNHGENANCNFYCNVCDKRFGNDVQLNEHKLLHTSDNTYTCDQCNKQFKTKLKLKYHMDVHNPEKPYVCDIGSCDRAFRTPKYLKNHKDEFHKLQPKTHTCPVCEQIFQRKSHLKRHMTTHDGEKKYHCSWENCNRSFRSQETLNIHYFRHTGEKPFKCELCEFSCRQKSALNYHYKHTHSKDANPLIRSTPNGMPSSNYSVSAESRPMRNDLALPNRPCAPGDVYAFTTDLDSHHERNGCQVRQDEDEEDSQMESHIDGIIHHLDEDNNLMNLFSSSRSELLAGHISSIVSDIISRKQYNFFATTPLTMQELFYVDQSWLEACKQPPKQPGRKRKCASNTSEALSSNKFQCPNSEYLPINTAVSNVSPVHPSACMTMESSSYHNTDPISAYSNYHSPIKVSDRGNMSMMEKPDEDEGVVDDCDTKSVEDGHSIVEDSVGLGLNGIGCDDDDASGSNGLPGLISSVAKDIVEETNLHSHIDHDNSASDPSLVRSRGAEEKDLLAQVLEDLKVIEQHDVQRHMSTGQPMTPDNTSATPSTSQHHSTAFSGQPQPAFPPQESLTCVGSAAGGTTIVHNPTVTSTSDSQQPKSLDSSLWSDSGYSSGHDSGGVQQPKLDGSNVDKSTMDSALTSTSTLLDMYNPYCYSSAQIPGHGYSMPNPYDASYGRTTAGFGDFSQAYRASGLGTAMGDHLRSLTALGSKYMDPSPYSSQLPGFSERSSLSGLSSTPHMSCLPGWPSTTGLADTTPATPLQYHWPVSGLASAASTTPVSSAASSTVSTVPDYPAYVDYLSARAAATSLNPFDPTGGKSVDAYRSALNDYRNLTQAPTAAADLYSQMAASASYDKYASLYGGRETFYGAAGQRGLSSLTGESPFQPKQPSPYSDRSSYIPGANPFYPQSQYYLAAGRQFPPAGSGPFSDPYRNPMLQNMPFNRYPF